MARGAENMMASLKIGRERPPHSPFCVEVYIFALLSLEDVMAKRPLWLLERKKMDGSRSVCRTVAHTTSGRAPSQETGASRNLFKKVYLGHKMIDERAGDER